MALRPNRIAGAVRREGKLIPIEEGQSVPPPDASSNQQDFPNIAPCL